ncbi:hypothetical protein MLD38_031733 [Melastoma candidum]|uniref:Uncharacterized protein n=1 Tax=Melastoma candidum TaxID=119954 RepID=A0ACB9MR77_9MYRT|nr:hypothetical protein MLD38_031733 [Melastoma candidum]
MNSLKLSHSEPPVFHAKSDLMFVCLMPPSLTNIGKDDGEIVSTKWMSVEEYIVQPFVRENKQFYYITKICARKVVEGDAYPGFGLLAATSRTQTNYITAIKPKVAHYGICDSKKVSRAKRLARLSMKNTQNSVISSKPYGLEEELELKRLLAFNCPMLSSERQSSPKAFGQKIRSGGSYRKPVK